MPELVLLAALLGALIALVLRRFVRRVRMRGRFRRAERGEREAERLLRRRGYVILDDQVRRTGHVLVDGEPVEYEVRADLLAARRGRTYVVEVKTGKKAPRPTHAATRRQLREYAEVYEADGLLLADMSAGELRAIEFPSRSSERGRTRRAATFLAGALFGASLAVALARFVSLL